MKMSIMYLDKGIRADDLFNNFIEGAIANASNVIYSPIKVKNEDGFTKIFNNENKYINLGIIETNTEFVSFDIDEEGYSVISRCKDDGTRNIILRTELLKFNVTYPIEGVFVYNFQRHLIISFTDNFNTPKLINLDCLPFELTPEKDLIEPDKINLINLFVEFVQPNYKLKEIVDNGGRVSSGVYYITGAYVLQDGTETNTFHLSNQISIIDDNKTLDFNQIDGVEYDTVTNKAIKLAFDGLDTRFNKLAVYVARKANGVIYTYLLGYYNYRTSYFEITITGTENITEVPPQQLLVPTVSYRTIKTMTKNENKIVAANFTTRTQVNLQQIANKIKVKWVAEDEVSLNAYENSYKDSITIFNKRTFRAGEVYAIYIDGVYPDGTYTKAAVIPGRDLEDYDKEIINLDDNVNTFRGLPRFKLQSTAKEDGTMGAWENDNELYPDDDCYDVVDINGNNLPDLSLRNKNVRHHRFPTLRQLVGWDKKFVDKKENNINVQAMTINKFEVINTTGMYTPTGGVFGIINPSIKYTVIKFKEDFYNTTVFEKLVNTSSSDHRLRFKAKVDTNIFGSITLNMQAVWDTDLSPVSGAKLTFIVKIKRLNGNYENLVSIQGTRNAPAKTLNIVSPGLFGVYYQSVPVMKEGEELIIEPMYIERTVSPTVDTTYTVTVNNLYHNVNSETSTYDKTITSKILGIKLENIQIPDDIKKEIIGIRVLYAIRNINNCTMVGQGVMIHKHWESNTGLESEGRFHSFDMMFKDYDIRPDYVQPELFVKNLTDNSTFLYDFTSYNYITNSYTPAIEAYRGIEKIFKIPHDLPMPNVLGINNERRESFFYVKMNNNLTLPSNPGFNTQVLVNLVSYRADCYKDFDEQELASTGTIIPINGLGSETGIIYGGDTFRTGYHLRIFCKDEKGEADKDLERMLSYFCESNSNIWYRHEDKDNDLTKYAPKTDLIDYLDNYTYPVNLDKYRVDNYFIYNDDYSSINNLSKAVPFKCESENCESEITDFRERIHRSLGINKEASLIGWRTFLATEYHEMTKDKGEIWKVTMFRNSLIIHHKYSMFIDTIKDKLATNIQEVYLGRGDLFEREPEQLVDTKTGYAGCQSQWAAIVCKLGYFFIDTIQGKVFLFDGTLKEISNNGNFDWFRNYSKIKFPDIDSPFAGNGYWACYDDENNRILFGKRQIGEHGLYDNWTLSYSPDQSNIASFHTYLPSYGFQILDKTYLVDNFENRGIYRMNDGDKKCIYFTDEIHPSSIDLVFNLKQEVTLQSINIDVQIMNGMKLYKDKTITGLIIYTYTQCSGFVEVEKSNRIFDNKSAKKWLNSWVIDKFKDIVINPNDGVINDDFSINTTNLRPKKLWFNKSKFMNTYFVVRLIFDNKDQLEVNITDVQLITRKTNR